MSIKKVSEYLYLATYFLYCFTTILDGSLFPTGLLIKIDKYLSLVGCFIVLFMIFWNKKIKMKYMVTMLSAFIILCVIALISDRTTLIIIFSFFVCAEATSFNKIVKVSMFATLCCIVFVVLSCVVGILPDMTYIHDNSIAHSLGFSYYSNYAYPIMFASIMYLYIKDKKVGYSEILGLVALNYFVYVFSSTRLPFLLSLLMLLLYVAIVKWNLFSKKSRLMRYITIIAFPSGILVCYLMMVFYSRNKSFWSLLNKMVSGRLEIGHDALLRYPVVLLGRPVEMIGNSMIEQGLAKPWEYFFIDSGYLYSLVVYGLLFTVCIAVVYSILYYCAWLLNEKILFIWLTVILFFMFINNCWLSINQNPMILCFFPMMKMIRSSNNMYMHSNRSPRKMLVSNLLLRFKS